MAKHPIPTFHYIGCFLLLTGAILLLITCISSPTVPNISILTVDLINFPFTSVNFGTFGYCLLFSSSPNSCSSVGVGYSPSSISGFSAISNGTNDDLTQAMVLHPIACGLAFIAFLLAIGAGFCGSLLASLVGLLAWLLALIAMAIDFQYFGSIRDNVNNNSSNSAYFGAGMWTILAAMIVLFFASIITFLSCCHSRRNKKKHHAKEHEAGHGDVTVHVTTSPGKPKHRRRAKCCCM